MFPDLQKSPSRRFALWLGSYSVAAILLLFYFKVPILPVILAGIFTFALTFRKRS